MLLCELDEEGVSLDDHVAADLVVGACRSRGVDYGLGDLELLSLGILVVGPCPPHVDDALVEDLQSDVEVGEDSDSVDQSHAHLRLFEGLSKHSVVVEDRVQSVLEVSLAAQVQVLVLGASVENFREFAELQGLVQGLRVAEDLKGLEVVVIFLLELDDVALLGVTASEICVEEVRGVSDDDRLEGVSLVLLSSLA